MATTPLLRPTVHVEVELTKRLSDALTTQEICEDVSQHLRSSYHQLCIGQEISDLEYVRHRTLIDCVAIADYTGPAKSEPGLRDVHALQDVRLDVQTYALKHETEGTSRRRISQGDEPVMQHFSIVDLPNARFKDDWNSLIYDDALPAHMLRYLTRMLDIMRYPGLNISAFNWNRLCLLYGPPGSGKSTLCRALAQKLSIRLSQSYPAAVLIEVNMNSLLSKYFGESGKLISAMFDRIRLISQSSETLICVVMDEIESLAGSRLKSSNDGECNDGLRATNELLTALDRIRTMPNILVLCTSNLIDALDPAFLDRVDIKQLIPSPSPAAIYNIFRSCLNELIRVHLIDETPDMTPPGSPRAKKRRRQERDSPSPASPTNTPCPAAEEEEAAGRRPSRFVVVAVVEPSCIPTYAAMYMQQDAHSAGSRVWALAQRCPGFSGRALRRMPIQGLAMYTWGGACSLLEAVAALEAAVEQELKAREAGDAARVVRRATSG